MSAGNDVDIAELLAPFGMEITACDEILALRAKATEAMELRFGSADRVMCAREREPAIGVKVTVLLGEMATRRADGVEIVLG